MLANEASNEHSKENRAASKIDKHDPDMFTQPDIIGPQYPAMPRMQHIPRCPEFAPDQLTVKFEESVDAAAIMRELEQTYGARVTELAPGADKRLKNVFVLKVDPLQLGQVLGDLKVRDDVVYAERVAYRYPL